MSLECFYLEKDQEGKSLIDKWSLNLDAGKAIVPSIYNIKYQNKIIEIITKFATNKEVKFLSIGSGCGVIEKELHGMGYLNVTCLDYFKEFTDITKSKNLNSITGDIFELELSTYNVIYLDGSMGHLASSYEKNFDMSYHKILHLLYEILEGESLVIFSDDTPYNDEDYQVHPKVKHLRVSDKNFFEQLNETDFSILHSEKFVYDRENLKNVTRRIVVASKGKEKNLWDAKKYHNHASYVSNLAEDLVDVLDPKKEEKILDLGCGDGTLALKIAQKGAKVIGVDLSQDMVEKTRERGLEAYKMSALELNYMNEFDAVFSNAVLHWIDMQKEVLTNIYDSLKKGGRFVGEMGAEGNIQHLINEMRNSFNRHESFGTFKNPWYFPTREEYISLLNAVGFDVEYIEVIERPTKIDHLSNWLNVFANGIVNDLSSEDKIIFEEEVVSALEKKLYVEEEGWMVDYVRLRFKAVKN